MKLTDLLLSRRKGDAENGNEDGGSVASWAEEVQSVPIYLVAPGKYQPRQEFCEGALAELAESIAVHGLLQPILVRRVAVGYEVIVGERRLRACKTLGWEAIPAIVKDVDDREVAEMALIENLQREDLHVFEIAEGYERLIGEFQVTQEELAERLGISQANVANKIRLLKLPPRVREIISREMLSERHSRALLRLATEEEQLAVVELILKESLSVKQTEEVIRNVLQRDGKGTANKPGRGKRRKLIIKDLRLFTNSMKQLVNTLKSSGLDVKMEEMDTGESYELRVTVVKPQGGEGNS